MTNILGNFSNIASNANFTADMYAKLGEAGLDANVLKVANALNQAPLDQLSGGERQTLLHVTDQLAGDGVLSAADADSLVQMISNFSDQGADAFGKCWPFADINLGNMLGNILFNGLAGALSGMLGQSMNDCAFQNTVNGLLGQASDNAWSGALQGAFDNANLANLNASERTELVSMLSVAVADGEVNWPEADVILSKLNKAQGQDCGCQCPTPAPQPEEPEWSVEQNGSQATIDLGDYTLEINEKRSEFVLTNKETGESSRVWGDPHFDMDNDGTTDVDFWGTMTMNLENGTKITIQTTPWEGNEDMTVSSRLVITQGDKAIEVSGMDQNDIGDMEISQSDDGRFMDTFTGDGLDIYENSGTWMVPDGLQMREVTQEDMNTTKGDQSDFSLVEGLQALAAFVASGSLLGSLLSTYSAVDNK